MSWVRATTLTDSGITLPRDGTVRDTVMYSMTAGEWPEAKAQLLSLLAR
jgi:hypothetical protein